MRDAYPFCNEATHNQKHFDSKLRLFPFSVQKNPLAYIPMRTHVGRFMNLEVTINKCFSEQMWIKQSVTSDLHFSLAYISLFLPSSCVPLVQICAQPD